MFTCSKCGSQFKSFYNASTHEKTCSGIKPRMQVEILESGKWVGPFTVTALAGRTPDHLVLNGPSGMFEIHNDAPFNIRPVSAGRPEPKHDWEPGEGTRPMQTDPSCRVCGEVKGSHRHY